MIDAVTDLSIRPTFSPSGADMNFASESLGILTQPVDLPGWESQVRRRYGFLANLDDDERRWAACDPRHRREVEAALSAGGFPTG